MARCLYPEPPRQGVIADKGTIQGIPFLVYPTGHKIGLGETAVCCLHQPLVITVSTAESCMSSPIRKLFLRRSYASRSSTKQTFAAKSSRGHAEMLIRFSVTKNHSREFYGR